jgi:hypothetical protein
MIPSDMIQVLLVIMDINYVQKIQELVVLLHTIKRNFYLVFNLWIRKIYKNGGLMDILKVFDNNNSNVSSWGVFW